MALLTKDQILSAADLPKSELEVPEWGGSVNVRTLTAAEREKWEERVQSSKAVNPEFNVRGSLLALCIVDNEGKQLFSIVEIPALAKKSAAATDRVFDECCRLNRIGADKIEEAKKNERKIKPEFLSES
jgi:hypothetical protein